MSETSEDGNILRDIPVRVSVVLGHINISVEELLRLNGGDVVELDKHVGEPVEIWVNDKPLAQGELVIVEDRVGVKVTDRLLR